MDARQRTSSELAYGGLSSVIGQRFAELTLWVVVMVCLAMIPGCQTPSEIPPEYQVPYIAVELAEGDVVQISFSSAPNLDTTQKIRRDGMITLPLVGELKAVGATPTTLEKEVLKLYESELKVTDVTVTVVSSSIPVFVTGSVLQPGKVMVDRPLTALEAIMETGGFTPDQAKTDRVVVIRHEEGHRSKHILNFKKALKGKDSTPFYMKPGDIIYVPMRSL